MMNLLRMCVVVFLATSLVACDAPLNPDSVMSSKASVVSKPLPNYKTARKVFWRSVYSGRVQSLYCGETFNSDQRRGYNVEHVFPMSWATNGLNCGTRKQCRANSTVFNKIEADLHNLYPARVDVNKERSSYRYGLIAGETRKFGACDVEIDYRARSVEPADNIRGEIARAMFYMAYQYKEFDLRLFDKQAKLLIKWHEADRPSQEETRRNNKIERIQGNRNPFVDEPELLQRLYRDGFFRGD